MRITGEFEELRLILALVRVNLFVVELTAAEVEPEESRIENEK